MSILECAHCGKVFDEEEIEYERKHLYTIVKTLNGHEKFIEVNKDEGKCPYCGLNIEEGKDESV